MICIAITYFPILSYVLKRFIGFQSEINSRITIIEGKNFNFCEINGSRDDNDRLG
jgi:hypothetical protein